MPYKKDNLPAATREYKAVLIKPWLVLVLVFVPCFLGNYLGHSMRNYYEVNFANNNK